MFGWVAFCWTYLGLAWAGEILVNIFQRLLLFTFNFADLRDGKSTWPTGTARRRAGVAAAPRPEYRAILLVLWALGPAIEYAILGRKNSEIFWRKDRAPLHFSIHSRCLFVIHHSHWHWLSSVRVWRLCYSAEHTKHWHSGYVTV